MWVGFLSGRLDVCRSGKLTKKRWLTSHRLKSRCLPPSAAAASAAAAASSAMDPDACWRACVAFRVKLSRDTGVNLTTDDCLSFAGGGFRGEGRRADHSSVQ